MSHDTESKTAPPRLLPVENWKLGEASTEAVPLDSDNQARGTKDLPPPTLAPTPNAAALWTVLRRRWVFAVFLGMLGAGVAGAVTSKLTKSDKNIVRAMVHLAATPDSILPQTTPSAERFQFFQKTQMALVKSQVVLDAALKNLESEGGIAMLDQPLTKERLLQEIEVDFTQGPEVLRITMKGPNPKELIVLVNAVMKAYLDEFMKTELNNRRDRLQRIKQWHAERRKILTEKQQVFRRIASATGGGSLVGRREARDRQFESAREQLRSRQEERKGLEAKLLRKRQRASLVDKAPQPYLLDRELDADPLVKDHRAAVEKLERRVAAVRASAQPWFAEDTLDKEGTLKKLEHTRALLEESIAKIRPKLVKKLRAKAVADLESDRLEFEGQIAILEEQEKLWNAVVEELAREKKIGGENDLEVQMAAREVEEEEKIVKSIDTDIRAIEADQTTPPRARLLDNAIASDPVSGKKEIVITTVASVGMLGLVIVGVALCEFGARKVGSTDEVIHGFGVDLVGTLPPLTRKKRSQPLVSLHGGPCGHWGESIDSCRMLLLRKVLPGSMRVLMVTSAMPGEGKSSLCSHLAISMARAGFRTLLVDADIRNPTVHRLFGLPRGPGLSEVLEGSWHGADVARVTSVEGLYVITAGGSEVATNFHSTKNDVGDLFEVFKQNFDCVLVDSSPILPVASSLLLAQRVDGVIVSMLRNVSRMPKISAAMHRLRMLKVTIVGAVVSGSDEDVYSSRYHVSLPTVEE